MMNIPLQPVYFPGHTREAACALVGIVFDSDASITRATIVAIQNDATRPGTSLWNSDEGRDVVLNKVLDGQLRGVRTDFVRFVSIIDDGDRLHAIELPIRVDVDDFVDRGNPHDKRPAPAEDWAGALLSLVGAGDKHIEFWSGHVVGGCARFVTVFDERKSMEPEHVDALLSALNYPSFIQGAI